MTQTFRPTAAAALRAYRASKPWRGAFPERWAKLEALHQALCAAYGLRSSLFFRATYYETTPPELMAAVTERERGDGAYAAGRDAIILVGKVSVVTYLFTFAAARGMRRDKALNWARKAFARFFPRSFGRCRVEGDVLVRAAVHDDDGPNN